MSTPTGSTAITMGRSRPYRTCCNCCDIKTGTVFLGLVELVGCLVLAFSLIRQLMGKDKDLARCFERNWRDCLTLNFSHSHLTLAGDYVILFTLFAITVCIVLLFYGIFNVRPRLLLPHLVVQLIGLLCSLTYFLIYAWSYFYGDIYTQKRHFHVRQLVERTWLATMIMFFSAFQCYLFVTVLKCSLYLQKIKSEQHRRTMQFEEVSNRVRRAKANGLWKETSWGGVFQQYRGQYDDADPNQRKEKAERRKERAANRVQWDLQKNTEKSLSCGVEDSTDTAKNEEALPLAEEKSKPMAEVLPVIAESSSSSAPRSHKLAKQKSKSSSQESGTMPPIIPVVEGRVPPPIRRIKKEKSSDSLLGNSTIRHSPPARSSPPHQSNSPTGLRRHRHSPPNAQMTQSMGPMGTKSRDSPPHRQRVPPQSSNSSQSPPRSSPIRRTSVDLTPASNVHHNPTGRPKPQMAASMSSPNVIADRDRRRRPPDMAYIRLGNFPTNSFDQSAMYSSAMTDSDMSTSPRANETKAGLSIQFGSSAPSSSTVAAAPQTIVKKISITSKVPPFVGTNF